MSGKRIVEETPCPDCDRFHIEPYLLPGANPESSIAYCYTGGTFRTLTEGQYVLIEKVDGEWPRDQVFAMFNEGCLCDTDEARSILDALSDHTEGTP